MIASKHKGVAVALDTYSSGALLSFIVSGSSPQESTAALEAVVADLKLVAASSKTVDSLRKKVRLFLAKHLE